MVSMEGTGSHMQNGTFAVSAICLNLPTSSPPPPHPASTLTVSQQRSSHAHAHTLSFSFTRRHFHHPSTHTNTSPRCQNQCQLWRKELHAQQCKSMERLHYVIEGPQPCSCNQLFHWPSRLSSPPPLLHLFSFIWISVIQWRHVLCVTQLTYFA